MSSRFASVAVLALLLPALAFAAPKKPAPSPTETPIDIDAPSTPAPDGGVDLDAAIEDAPAPTNAASGAAWIDKALGAKLASPGVEWAMLSPVPEAPGARAAFLHVRGEKVRAMIVVGVDLAPDPKDASGYAKKTFASLAELGFEIQRKGPLKVAGKDAFAIAFVTKNALRRYEQYYVPGPKGSLVVLTFQAPAPIFDAEVKDFRTTAQGLAFR